MAERLEIQFRVYYIPEPGAKKECIATRSVPHALQVWNESVDAYSRSLELVISGDWLMKLLAEDGKGAVDDPEVDRATIIDLCLKALSTVDDQKKEEYLRQVLTTLDYKEDI